MAQYESTTTARTSSEEKVRTPDATSEQLSAVGKGGDAQTIEKGSNDTEVDETENYEGYLSGFKLYLIVLGLCISVLLVALDQAIITTAVPTITTRFDSLADVGWYGSGYLITTCAFQPVAAKLFTYFSLKWMYLGFVVVFELGSLICAVAPNSETLIVGRAIAGIGSAGLFSGALTIIAHTIPLRLRPLYSGIIGSMFGFASIMGPLLGGVFTQYVSWRWCFYINLPCGAITVAALTFFFHPPVRPEEQLPLKEKMGKMDLLGFFIFMPSVTMLLLAIQWGGNKYAWKSATIIGLICGFGVTILIFAAWQWFRGDEASIPPKIFTQRTVFFSALCGAFSLGTLQLVMYYIPIWFQVIKGASPSKSGVMNLPLIAGNVAFSILAGAMVTKLGYTNPFMLLGGIFLAIGSGLLTTFEVDSGHPKWIGYQFLVGSGTGCVIQMPLMAVQTVLPMNKVATGTAMVVFFQFFGGSIFLAIAQSIFQTKLVDSLIANVPGIDVPLVVSVGATGARKIVTAAQLPGVLEAYNTAITNAFYLAVAGGALGFFSGLFTEWRNVKNVKFTGGGH